MSSANDGAVDPQALSQMEEMGISQEDAILCLKACKNDLSKAAEYYFGGELDNQRNANVWDEDVWSSERWAQETQEPTPSQIWAPIPTAPTPSKRIAFDIHAPDSYPSDPKSRPPSRDNDFRRALQASLEDSQPSNITSSYGPQETGTTASYTAHSNLRPARDVYYDQNKWGMVVSSVDQAVEIFLDPSPNDRKRKPGEPVFLKPSPSSSNLAPLITILHSIPGAREELLWREHVLEDYGQNENWWMGQVIQLPKIINLEDFDHPKVDSQDIIVETQRIMSFLDSSERAYGSAESLASISGIFDQDNSAIVPNFFKQWSQATQTLSEQPERKDIMHTTAVRHEPDQPELRERFMCLDMYIPKGLVEGNGNLYDCLDYLIWANDDDKVEDYLEKLADVFTIHLKRGELGEKGVGVDIPGELYLDRYTEAFKDDVREMKRKRDAIVAEINTLDAKEARLQYFSEENDGTKVFDALKLMDATINHFSDPLQSDALKTESVYMTAEQPKISDIVQKLRKINLRILRKLEELSFRKRSAREALQELKALATAPDKVPAGSPPLKRYTLRGVATDPSTTYILRRTDEGTPPEENINNSNEVREWWLIRYSSHAYSAGEEPTGGYEIKVVSEEYVLRAARFEGDGIATLVYASEEADRVTSQELPEALQRFVTQDNLDFQTEVSQAEVKKSSGKKRLWWDDGPSSRDSSDNTAGPSSGAFDSGLATPGNSRRNSYSEDVSGSTETLMPPPNLPPPPPPPRPHQSQQDTEMQSLPSSSLYLSALPSEQSDAPPEAEEQSSEHVEFASSVPQQPRARLDLDM